MQNYLVYISYDGTNYAGYQLQKNAVTVAGKLIEALSAVFGTFSSFHGCSRTDSGVHAREFAFSFKSEKILEEISVVKALNFNLPDDISVRRCEYVSDNFHARYDVVRKEYIYFLYTGKTRDPFLKNYSFFINRDLDIDKMNRAAQSLVGTHDFSAFCASGGKIEDKTRTIYSAFFESIFNDRSPVIDTYDMASWMAITPLSERSIMQGGQPMAIPDFTRGQWLCRTDSNQAPYSLER